MRQTVLLDRCCNLLSRIWNPPLTRGRFKLLPLVNMAMRHPLYVLLVLSFGSAAATYTSEECDDQGAVHLVQTKVGRAKKRL